MLESLDFLTLILILIATTLNLFLISSQKRNRKELETLTVECTELVNKALSLRAGSDTLLHEILVNDPPAIILDNFSMRPILLVKPEYFIKLHKAKEV